MVSRRQIVSYHPDETDQSKVLRRGFRRRRPPCDALRDKRTPTKKLPWLARGTRRHVRFRVPFGTNCVDQTVSVKLLRRFLGAIALGVGAIFGHKAEREVHWSEPPNCIADNESEDRESGDV